MNPIQSLSIKDVKTATGAFHDKLNLFYQHFGQPLDKAPVVLINHSLTGNADVAGQKGWWKELVGAEKTINTNLIASMNIIKSYVKIHKKKKLKTCRIINFGSIYGSLSPSFDIYKKGDRFNSEIYGATKASIIQITKREDFRRVNDTSI